MATATRPQTLAELRDTPWQSRTVKEELRQGMIRALEAGEELFPGIVGYEETVIPEVILAMLAGHDMLFLGEKGQAKSRIMRSLIRFLEPEVPYLAIPGCPLHEDPYAPITRMAKAWLAGPTRARCRSRGGSGRTATRSDSPREPNLRM